MLCAAALVSLRGQLPPGELCAQQGFATAPVDHSIAHNAVARCVVHIDQRLAARGRLAVHHAAAARADIVQAGIARSEEGNAATENERDVWPQHQRPAEDCIFLLVYAHDQGAAFAAAVNRFLNAGGIEFLFVGRRKGPVDGLKLGIDRAADGRKERLQDGPGVLRGESGDEGGSQAKREEGTEDHGTMHRCLSCCSTRWLRERSLGPQFNKCRLQAKPFVFERDCKLCR